MFLTGKNVATFALVAGLVAGSLTALSANDGNRALTFSDRPSAAPQAPPAGPVCHLTLSGPATADSTCTASLLSMSSANLYQLSFNTVGKAANGKQFSAVITIENKTAFAAATYTNTSPGVGPYAVTVAMQSDVGATMWEVLPAKGNTPGAGSFALKISSVTVPAGGTGTAHGTLTAALVQLANGAAAGAAGTLNLNIAF